MNFQDQYAEEIAEGSEPKPVKLDEQAMASVLGLDAVVTTTRARSLRLATALCVATRTAGYSVGTQRDQIEISIEYWFKP